MQTPTVKVVFLGAAASGKSSLIARYVDSSPPKSTYQPTIGVSYYAKIENVFGNKIRMDIWELAGPERFAILAPMLWKGAQIIVILFDITDKSRSYERALIWVDNLKESGCTAPIGLLATKIDLPLSDHQVSYEMGKGFATRAGISIYEEVSAVSGQNMQKALLAIAELGLRNYVQTEDSKLLNAPQWVPDSSCLKCCQCNQLFTFANRRHHCRSCGFIFCATCSSKKIPLPQYGINRAVRVCKACFQSKNN